MLMITGCRRGEIVGMKWSNVNWEDSSILINSATPQRGVYESATKTEEQSVIITPLSEISITSGGMPVKIPNFKENTAEVKANE